MKLLLFCVISAVGIIEKVSGQCSDSIIATFIEEVLEMKDTISSLQSTISLLEYRVDELESSSGSCDGSSTNAQESGTLLFVV